MKRALIIDDEPLARSILKQYLLSYPQIEIVSECNDGFEGVKAIMQYQPHLIFLDIQMPKINGFEMLELLDEPPLVIFTTAFEEHAIKAFETHAVDYLLKPFTRERFGKAIEKWLQLPVNEPASANKTAALLSSAARSPMQQDRIVVKTGSKIKVIPVSQIQYLEAADDYVSIHTQEGAFLKNRTMQFFEQMLDPRHFIRVHRSYIINVQEIIRLDPYEKDTYIAILKSGPKIPISKAGYTRLKAVLGM
ncbi:MAG: LytR/AlgR family response regulator transcription factor [Sphingobacteriaceae bacterium]